MPIAVKLKKIKKLEKPKFSQESYLKDLTNQNKEKLEKTNSDSSDNSQNNLQNNNSEKQNSTKFPKTFLKTLNSQEKIESQNGDNSQIETENNSGNLVEKFQTEKSREMERQNWQINSQNKYQNLILEKNKVQNGNNKENSQNLENLENVEKVKNIESLEKRKNEKLNQIPLIKLEKLEKYYLVGGEKQMVIKGIDLEIWTGETVAILGKSGSGKSTLLNILGLLDAPTGGTYFLNGYNVNTLSGDFLATTRARTFGFIFQQFNLLPKLTVLENVIMPIRYTRDATKWDKRFETAHNLLKMVEIDEQSGKLPKLLSGGQQQRVAIARSLVNQPKVVIGDEPTGALDSKTAGQIVKQIFELNKELGVTVIIVTHDEDLAYKCGRVIRLVDGLIVDENTPLESVE